LVQAISYLRKKETTEMLNTLIHFIIHVLGGEQLTNDHACVIYFVYLLLVCKKYRNGSQIIETLVFKSNHYQQAVQCVYLTFVMNNNKTTTALIITGKVCSITMNLDEDGQNIGYTYH
jgi:hypothetical protein